MLLSSDPSFSRLTRFFFGPFDLFLLFLSVSTVHRSFPIRTPCTCTCLDRLPAPACTPAVSPSYSRSIQRRGLFPHAPLLHSHARPAHRLSFLPLFSPGPALGSSWTREKEGGTCSCTVHTQQRERVTKHNEKGAPLFLPWVLRFPSLFGPLPFSSSLTTFFGLAFEYEYHNRKQHQKSD